MSPTNYQQMIRLSKAKDFLCETTLGIGKIADRLRVSVLFWPHL